MLKSEFWGAVVSSIIIIGVPALVWGGSISSEVKSLATQQAELRKDLREDLREINRKLDELRANQQVAPKNANAN